MKNTNYAYSSPRAVSYDEGLRSYMLYVYHYMTAALILTATSGLLSISTGFKDLLYSRSGMTPLGMIVSFAPFAIALIMGFGVQKAKLKTTQLLFWSYAALSGISFSFLAEIYTGTSIIRAFFITSAVFGAMSIYGYVTKKDLSSLGSLLIMGVFGLILASVVNMFLQSSALNFAFSLLGVIIFVGLVAYDTQKIKSMYYAMGNYEPDMAKKIAIMGYFTLYIDFINLFLYIIRFVGDRRRD